MSAVSEAPATSRTRRTRRLSWSGRVGLTLLLFIVGVALLGPVLSPHSPTAIVGPSFSGPGPGYPLGTDFLGRDVLSRVLWGGRSVLALAGAATLIAYLIGATIGMVAGYTRTIADSVLMRAMDVLLVFPPFLLLLVLATGSGGNAATIIAGVALVQIPQIARIIRAATLEVAVRAHVEAAVARGESMLYILPREVFPNIVSTVVADAGPRYTGSILLIAGLTFLGLGLQPPAANWALMISENRDGLTFAPLGLLVPAALIALLTIGVNLLGDALATNLGRSVDTSLVRR